MLPFSTTLRKARLEKRYKRFFADVILDDGTPATAHCPNTGSMATCMSPGCEVLLSSNDDPKRKLRWTWELTATTGGFIGVNTARPNAIVYDAVSSGKIPELAGYAERSNTAKTHVSISYLPMCVKALAMLKSKTQHCLWATAYNFQTPSQSAAKSTSWNSSTL